MPSGTEDEEEGVFLQDMGMLDPKSIEAINKTKLLPYTFVLLSLKTVSLKPLLCLLDSGSTRSWISQSCLPKGINGQTVDSVNSSTLAGPMKSTQIVEFNSAILPEFHRSRKIHNAKFLLFNTPIRYDIIIGRDLLSKIGMNLNFAKMELTWDEATLPMRHYPEPQRRHSPSFIAEQMLLDHIEELLLHDYNDEVFATSDNYHDGDLGYKSKTIKDAQYEKANIKDVVDNCTHLNDHQRSKLYDVLRKFEKLFDGTLGLYPHEKIHLELIEGAKPHYSKPYQVPERHKEVFKKELDRLVSIGVLKKCGRSEWSSGTFVVPKSDSTVRWV